jgi:aminoglycoside phosphotransferase (APT) family kinase protein
LRYRIASLDSSAGSAACAGIGLGRARNARNRPCSRRAGQDLIEQGRAHDVLAGCGTLLRHLHDLDPAILGAGPAEGGVIRHGDFGPNNLLFDLGTLAVTAVLDWKFSGIGEAIEDIAWCEWIVRMHHPHALSAMPAFFDAYGRGRRGRNARPP